VKTTILTLLLAMSALIVTAADPEPTRTPTPRPSSGDLSSVAGDITLNTEAVGESGGIVITNENLPAMAEKGAVTEVTKPGGGQRARGLTDVQPGALEGMPAAADTSGKKNYWQTLYAQQIELLTNISLQIEVLDQEIPGLWRDFYSWDDPAYRDGVIKPKLDEALAQRKKLEADLQAGQTRLDEIKVQARRDGGEPGWFRGLGEVPEPKPTRGVMPD
jgi:hypothetical protein